MPTSATDMVSAIDAAILSIVNKKTAAVTIDGESYTMNNLNDLRALRRYYDGIAAGDAAVAAGGAVIGISGLSAGSGK